MTGRKPPDTKALTQRPGSSSCQTGYGKPPQGSRFQPGQSGNPGGRPPGAKNKTPALNGSRLKDIIMEEAYRTISVHDGGENVTVPMIQAIIRSLTVAAVKGNARAQRLFTELLDITERGKAAQEYALLDMVIGYKADWERELKRRERTGTEGPEPFPHPDQIVVDLRGDGGVIIKGPLTRQEKAEVDKEIEGVRGLQATVEADLEDVTTKLTRVRSAKVRKELKGRILLFRSVLSKIRRQLSDLEYQEPVKSSLR